MNYYNNLTEEFDDIEERYELVIHRIRQITHEDVVKMPYRDYFTHVADFIARIPHRFLGFDDFILIRS